jgi:hypothetical protein
VAGFSVQQLSPAEKKQRLAALEQEAAELRRRLSSISPASEEWARIGHLVDGLRTEIELASGESGQILSEARNAIEVHRRRLSAEAREIMARAETEAASKMQELRVASDPILAEAHGRSAEILQGALDRVRDTIQVTGIRLEDLAAEAEPVPANVLAWLEKADSQPTAPQFAAAAVESEERYISEAVTQPTLPPAEPDAERGYYLMPLGQEGDFHRYQISGSFTFASLLALEQAVARLYGARSVSVVPIPGGAILSLMTLNPAELLPKLQTIPDFPMYM